MALWNTLRKFGLEYCDLPTMLWNVSVMLRVLTLNIYKRYKKRIPLVFYIISAVTAACHYYLYLISMVWFVFWRCQETGDLVAAMMVASLGVTSELGTNKLIFMFVYRDTVRELVAKYLDCDALVEPGSRFYKNLMKALRDVKKRAMIFWVVVMGNGLIYVLKPLFKPGRHLIEDMFTIYGLEPAYESPNYEIVLFLTTAGIAFTVYLPANVTAFLIIITGYIEAQMLALSEEMINLWSDAEQFYLDHRAFDIEGKIELVVGDGNDQRTKNKIVNEYVRKRLQEIIKIHITNINLLLQVENVFRWAIAVEFALLVIGLILKLLVGLEKIYLELPFSLMLVGMDCFAGQRVIDASVTFENAVYDCKWENFSVSNMKTVLLILQSSQKTLKLSAGGVTMLNFSCFMSVINSIYSSYATLRSAVKD